MKKITIVVNDTCVRLNLPGDRSGEIIITDKRGQEHSFPFAECELTDVDDLFTWSPPNQYVPESAEYFTFDGDGFISAYEKRPILEEFGWAVARNKYNEVTGRWYMGQVPKWMAVQHWKESLVARIDKAPASMTEKPTPERPFRRGEPVIMWHDEQLYTFIGFFVEHTDGGFVVSGNSELLHPLTWSHCKHLPPFIDWDLIDEYFGWAVEYDSGVLSPWLNDPTIGYKSSNFGTIVAVHKRPEADK